MVRRETSAGIRRVTRCHWYRHDEFEGLEVDWTSVERRKVVHESRGTLGAHLPHIVAIEPLRSTLDLSLTLRNVRS